MHSSYVPGGGSPPGVPPRSGSSSPRYAADDPRGWQIGWHESGGLRDWFGFPRRPYNLPLFAHSGAIFGHASEDLDMTLLRLGENAAAHGWKVVYVDAQGSQQMAARFLAVMHQHGKRGTRIFPNEPYDGLGRKSSTLFHHLLSALPAHEPHAQHLAALSLSALLTTYVRPPRTMELLVKRLSQLVGESKARSVRLRAYQHGSLLTSLRPMDLVGTPLRYAAFSGLVGKRLDGFWTFGRCDAAYLSFDGWNRPEQARVLAQWLMRELASTLAEGIGDPGRVLLLLKRPSLLFHSDQIAPLFALVEQHGGSVFLAERSPFDLSHDRQRILSNASTLLVHRSSSTRPFAPYVTHPFPRSFSDARISRLAPGQGYIITGGSIQPLRMIPVPLEQAAITEAQHSIPPHIEDEHSYQDDWPKVPSIWDDKDLDLDDDFPSLSAIEDEYEDLFDLEEPDKLGQAHIPAQPSLPETSVPVPTKRASHRTRSKPIRSKRSRRIAQPSLPDAEATEDTLPSSPPEPE